MLLSRPRGRCIHKRDIMGCSICRGKEAFFGQKTPGRELGLSLTGENVRKISARETGWARTAIPMRGSWMGDEINANDNGSMSSRSLGKGGGKVPPGWKSSALNPNYRSPSSSSSSPGGNTAKQDGAGGGNFAPPPVVTSVFGQHGFVDVRGIDNQRLSENFGGFLPTSLDASTRQLCQQQPTLRSSWSGANMVKTSRSSGQFVVDPLSPTRGAPMQHMEQDGVLRFYRRAASAGVPAESGRGGLLVGGGRTSGGGSSYRHLVRDLLLARGRPVETAEEEAMEQEELVREGGESTVWAVRGRCAGSTRQSEQFELVGQERWQGKGIPFGGVQEGRGGRLLSAHHGSAGHASQNYEQKYHAAYVQMQQQAQQLLCERQQLLSGALHGQRAGAALENMQTLASHQRACVATPCERQAIARDSLRKANNAQVQGAPCHPAESTPGTPTKAPSSEEDPQGCSPISSLADDPSYPLAHRTLQRDAPSSPVTKEGGAPSDQTVSSPGWTAVRASVKKANEPESPTAEAEKRRRLRAAKLAEDPLPRTNPLSAYGEYEMPTDEQWTKARKHQMEHFRGTEEEERVFRETTASLRARRGVNVCEGVKVFTVVGGNKNVRRSLTNRGMVEAEGEDADHNLFDIRWTLTHHDINFEELSPCQIANHFPLSAREIGSKVGLHRNLRSLKWFDSIDMDSFFPRMYNLANPWEMQDFADDYFFTAAHSEVVKYCRGEPVTSPAAKDNTTLTRQILQAAHRMVTAFLDNKALLSDPGGVGGGGTPGGVLSLEDYFALRPEKRPKEATGAGLVSPRGVRGGGGASTARTPERHLRTTPPSGGARWEDMGEDMVGEMMNACFERLRVEHSSQLESDGTRNIWIVKPGHGSRGRGIMCFDDLQKIIARATSRKRGAIVQKYVENCLLLEGRKFDIRLWVVVSTWNPLTVWVYEPYIRICTDLHSLDSASLSNVYKHLCNRCVQEGNEDYDSADEEGGCMWSVETLVDYLDGVNNGKGAEIWGGIRSKMMQVSQYVMHSVQECMDNRPGCFEWFGLDFMVDERYNTWLLECNISPDLSIGTEVLDKLVPSAMGELWDMLAMGPRVRESLSRDPEHCWDLAFRGKEIKKEVLQKRLWRKKNFLSQLREGRPFGMRVALQDKLGPLTNAYICSEVQKQRKMREKNALRAARVRNANSQKGKKKDESSEEESSSEDHE